jgi:hypothetical protein
LYAVDLESETGVYHGMTRLSSGWVTPGSFLRVGPYHVSVQFQRLPDAGPPAAPEDPIQSRGADPPLATHLAADLLVGNICRSRWKMTRRLVLVGRGDSARLRLRDQSVSELHLALVGTPQGTWAVDLLSREGTFVNGSPIRSALLRDGDRLQAGCYELLIRTEQSGARRSAPPTALTLPGREAPPVQAVTTSYPAYPPDATALLPLLQQFTLFQQQMMEQFQQSMMQMMQTFVKMNNDQLDLIREELVELRRLTEELYDAKQRLNSTPKEPTTPRAEIPAEATAKPAPPPPEKSHSPAPPVTPPPDPEPAPPAADLHDWLSGRIADLENQRQGILRRALRKLTGR